MDNQIISHGAQTVIEVGCKEQISFKVIGTAQPLLDVFYHDHWWIEP